MNTVLCSHYHFAEMAEKTFVIFLRYFECQLLLDYLRDFSGEDQLSYVDVAFSAS